jgi:hypothetical protein
MDESLTLVDVPPRKDHSRLRDHWSLPGVCGGSVFVSEYLRMHLLWSDLAGLEYLAD